MKQRLFIIAVVSAVVCQAGSLYASCPGDDDLTYIFCDDFDSYCTDGGPPGTPNCAAGSPKSNAKLQEVWLPITPGGTTMIVEDTTGGVISNVFSGKYTNPIYMGQESLRDWIASAGQFPGVLNLQRRINKVLGGSSNAVNGSAETPLVLNFQIASNLEKLYYSSGYFELALGDHTDPLNRANTDFAPQTANCCNESGRVFPVVCAQGNPDSTLPTACPSVGTVPPPLHQVIGVGAFALLDNDPCDGCNSQTTPTKYRQNVRHLVLFDGKVWWTLKNDATLPVGATISGSINPPLPDPPPANFDWQGGDFDLVSVNSPYKTQNSQCYNNVSVSVYATTISITMTSRVKTGDGVVYFVTSTVENFPRQYTGAFDRLRVGVAPGCQLASNTDWDLCATLDGRGPLQSDDGLGSVVDNLTLSGGVGVELPGACCKADGMCEVMNQAACEALDTNGNPLGRFTSVGQACNESVACCPLVYGDMDLDDDVDMDDFAELQACLTTGGGLVSDDCRCLDSDGDNGIDSDDVLKFVTCAKGPGIPADASVSCRGPGW